MSISGSTQKKRLFDFQPQSNKEKVLEQQKDKVIRWPHLFKGVMYFKGQLLSIQI